MVKLNTYEITDWENDGKKTIIKEYGISEAILKYLNCSSLEISISIFPACGRAVVVNQKNGHRYHVELL